MFFRCFAFDQSIGVWDVSNVTNMGYMFTGCPINQSLAIWDVSNVTNMEYMFNDSGYRQSLNSWDVRKVQSFRGMFRWAWTHIRGYDLDISAWEVDPTANCLDMFAYNTSFINKNAIGEIDLSGWTISYWYWMGLSHCQMVSDDFPYSGECARDSHGNVIPNPYLPKIPA
jgi:hypothetical protein